MIAVATRTAPGLTRRSLLAALLLAAAMPAPAAAPASLEGNWMIESIGTPDNHTAAGLGVARNERGELAVRITMPITNMFGIALGIAEPDGDARYAVKGEDLHLTLKDAGTLVVQGLVDDPVEMHRVATLPAEPPAPHPPAGPAPRWRTRLGGAIYAAPALRDGVAYVGNTDGVLFAVKLADGAPIWNFPAGRPIYGPALATGDAVYFSSDNGYLYRLNRADGKEVWKYDLGDGRVRRIPPNPQVFDYDEHGPAPLLVDGVLYIGAGDGGFHAVRADSGERVWRVQSNERIRTTAAQHGVNVVFATMDGWVVAVDRASGAERWSSKKTTAYTSGPAIFGDLVVAGNRGSVLRALDANSGAELWKQNYWGSWVESTAVFRDGRGYIGSGDLFVVSCFDPQTGKNLWRTHVNGWVLDRPALTDDRIYVGVSGGRRRNAALVHQSSALTALDRSSGRIVWSWSMPEWDGAFLSGFLAAPGVADGLVIAAGLDGSLYAFPEQH